MLMLGIPMYFWHDTWYSSDLDKNWYRAGHDTNKEHIKNLSVGSAPFPYPARPVRTVRTKLAQKVALIFFSRKFSLAPRQIFKMFLLVSYLTLYQFLSKSELYQVPHVERNEHTPTWRCRIRTLGHADPWSGNIPTTRHRTGVSIDIEWVLNLSIRLNSECKKCEITV